VGGTDASVAEARQALGAGKIVGASCYGDKQLARDASANGATYIAFGGFYPSKVKQYPVTTPAEIVDWAKAELSLPCVVIGGMTPANAAPLVARGADMVAAISSVYGAPLVDAAAQEFTRLFTR
jgi:thiamine-phosphate pyrophosphorylase